MTAATHTADLYLRLSDARLEEALDGREAKLRARAAGLGWAVHRVIVENDMVPGNGTDHCVPHRRGSAARSSPRPGGWSFAPSARGSGRCWMT